MNVNKFIILILPVILHIKGSRAMLVFFIMNSLINILMQYSREHMRILGSLIEDEDMIEEHINQGLSFEESQAIVTENFHTRDLDEWVPKGIDIVISLATIISLGGIAIGLLNIIRNLL